MVNWKRININHERKLQSDYIKYLVRIGETKLTSMELEYIKKRLNYYNHESRSLPEKRFKPGFWVMQAKYLTALPTIESLDGAYEKERNKVIPQILEDD